MKKEFIVKQNDIKDCGACCISSVIRYYKGFVPLEQIRLDTYTNINGTTAYNIINALKKYGFEAVGVKVNDIKDKNILLPAIVHVCLENGLNHFIVVYKITSKFILAMDPAKGMIRLEVDYFNKIWTKFLINLFPKNNILVLEEKSKLKGLFANIFKNQKRLFLLIIIFSFLITILASLISYFYKFGLMAINKPQRLTSIIILFVFISILKVLFEFFRDMFQNRLERNVDNLINEPFIKHFFKLPLRNIITRTTGEIALRFNEINNIKGLMIELFTTTFLDLILSLIYVVILSSINSSLFFLLLLIIAIYILVGFLFSPSIYRHILSNIDAESEYNSKLVERIDGFATIKNQNLIVTETQRLVGVRKIFAHNSYKCGKILSIYSFLQNFISEIGLVLVSGVGFIMISQGLLNVLDLLTFNSILAYLFEPIKNLVNIIPKYFYLKAMFTKVNEFLQISEERIGEVKKLTKNNIEYQQISYSYNGFNKNVSDVNLCINEGEHIILLGTSGIGKSTLCKLLMGYDYNYTGNILIGGVNVKDYGLNTVRKNVSYLSQDEKLFSTSLRENIIFNNDIDVEKINEVLSICRLKKFVDNLPMRLESHIEEDGANISGGEKQRVLLARTLLNSKNVVILDEALSEVSEEMERAIIKNVRKFLKGITLIYISHRDTSELFDRKIYLK